MKGPKIQTSVSRDAQRVAAAILEVLAGVRTPTDAAVALSVSLPRYYLWEQRALEGLVRACEPRRKGKVAGERHKMAVLEKELVRLRQDCARQQALVRASQRTIGLPPSLPPAARPAARVNGKTGGAAAVKAKRKRRPVARALKAAATLTALTEARETARESIADSSSANMAEMVQRSVPNHSSVAAHVAVAET